MIVFSHSELAEMVDKTTPPESLLKYTVTYVARIIVWFLIILGVVLAVDALILLLLNRLTDVETWLQVLFYEGLVLALFGGGAWMRGGGERPLPVTIPSGKQVYKVKVKFKYPWFWASVGIAGIALWVLAAGMHATLPDPLPITVELPVPLAKPVTRTIGDAEYTFELYPYPRNSEHYTGSHWLKVKKGDDFRRSQIVEEGRTYQFFDLEVYVKDSVSAGILIEIRYFHTP
ncbi:MAG: hypothetical protein JSW53_02635 [Candidatus Bathyarchaeota archaeon]|nr:MAG: hypothetical protein JSW53_02635 [Candidatus Bathyarchaeota archaeon]